jgi:hypothetical protein
VTDGALCLASVVVDGLVAICDRPSGHQPATLHYDLELDLPWSQGSFGRPVRAVLGATERREAEDAYRSARRWIDEAERGTG